ncbi:MAG TPA: SDR family oxidoreductase [Xanthobacteraceae bacterium]|nr:SDR family oxidoreductase [Xanthobacteraceae bacterium]
MTSIKGAAVALTGAASGIGRALARELAARGADLALADIDEPRLVALADELRQSHQVNISAHRVNVAEEDEIKRFAEAAIRQHPRLSVLINNAGVALQGWFEEMTLADFEWVMSINFWGVVRGTHYFLPHLMAQPEAHIVNLSSIFGLIAPVGQTAYSASKFGVRGFTEALQHELAATSVRVTSVHPGGVATNIANNSRAVKAVDAERKAAASKRFSELAKTTPEQAASVIVEGMLQNKPRVLIGGDARFIDRLQRWLPTGYWRVVAYLNNYPARPGAQK